MVITKMFLFSLSTWTLECRCNAKLKTKFKEKDLEITFQDLPNRIKKNKMNQKQNEHSVRLLNHQFPSKGDA